MLSHHKFTLPIAKKPKSEPLRYGFTECTTIRPAREPRYDIRKQKRKEEKKKEVRKNKRTEKKQRNCPIKAAGKKNLNEETGQEGGGGGVIPAQSHRRYCSRSCWRERCSGAQEKEKAGKFYQEMFERKLTQKM